MIASFTGRETSVILSDPSFLKNAILSKIGSILLFSNIKSPLIEESCPSLGALSSLTLNYQVLLILFLNEYRKELVHFPQHVARQLLDIPNAQ